MKRVAILTLTDNNNYGNRLQNYALQEAVKSLGFEAESIINTSIDKKNRNIWYFIKLISIKKVFRKIQEVIRKKIIYKQSKYKSLNKVRKENFFNFNKYIKNSLFVIENDTDFKKLENEYNYFIIGSDQIWNPYALSVKEINLGLFFPKHKNISYAASFGVNSIPENLKQVYKKGIENIEHISVREEQGAKIIKEITDKTAEVVVDPTILIDVDKWRKLQVVPKNVGKKYLLTYFLGKISKEKQKILNQVAEENDLTIINLGKIKEKDSYIAGPSEFLYYIDNAEAFFTDSFHGVVFSILFKTPFYVFERDGSGKSMNSRLETLLFKFQLEDRKITKKKISKDYKCNYDGCDEVLEQEKQKGIKFLKTALKIGE